MTMNPQDRPPLEELALDRLYNLLPSVYRQRDEMEGGSLRALLQIISRQVNLVEDDIAQLYDNWFIETCQDWVVPYIGDLVDYEVVHEAGEPGSDATKEGRARNKILSPRRDVAATIGSRRRKGTMPLLETLAADTAGWPARAVEFYTQLGVTWRANQRGLGRSRTVDLGSRNANSANANSANAVGANAVDAIDRLNGAFDESAHTIDVRRINSSGTVGRYNIPSVGLFVWRLKPYSITRAPARFMGDRCYTFSVLGNNTPLFTHPTAKPNAMQAATEINVPIPIRRRALQNHLTNYYGEDRSLFIWVNAKPVAPSQIVVANLHQWSYEPEEGTVLVDPELGRLRVAKSLLLHSNVRNVITVSYYYGFSSEVGGGEYARALPPSGEREVYYVSKRAPRGNGYRSINEAIKAWRTANRPDAIIEITDSGDYVENSERTELETVDIRLPVGGQLEVRSSNLKRPVIRLLDDNTSGDEGLLITVGDYPQEEDAPQGNKATADAEREEKKEAANQCGARVILDGLMIEGRGVRIEGELAKVTIRHCTLVPGWSLNEHCHPEHGEMYSIRMLNTTARLQIDHSIVGSISVEQDEVGADPITISINDSILDAANPPRKVCGSKTDESDEESGLSRTAALDAPGSPVAYAVLDIVRSTVFGWIDVHAIELAENCIFMERVRVARRQIGCMRFCYVAPYSCVHKRHDEKPHDEESRTPRRYNCQPDLVEKAVAEKLAQKEISAGERAREQQREHRHEQMRVRPQFNSWRYGTPDYCQLAATCAPEITQGADDASEMGVFHDLFQPQRAANLRVRLDEYTPAGQDAAIIFAD